MTRHPDVVDTAHATAIAVGVLVVAAIASAALTLGGARVLFVPAPYDALQATPATAAQLLAHNLVVTLWPLALIELGWPRLRGIRWAGDGLIAAQLQWHGALIGTALAQQPELWRYLPHLPFEAVALTVPAGAWISRRSGTRPSPWNAVAPIAVVIGLLAVAAGLETYAVPWP